MLEVFEIAYGLGLRILHPYLITKKKLWVEIYMYLLIDVERTAPWWRE